MKGDIETMTSVIESTTSANSSSLAATSADTQAANNAGFRHEFDNIADLAVECPLCMENLDIDDIDFFPCSCGYQVCRFCWHRLKNDENGLCPACRQEYPDSPIHFSAISIERVEELKKQKKKQKEKQKLKESNKANLSTIRVVQKNLLFVIGFSQRLSQEDLKKEFNKYGKIIKMVINTTSAYVTYTKAEDAVAAIKSLNELSANASAAAGKNGARASTGTGISSIRASLGTTKYCTHWLRCQTCPKQPDCMYLHEIADQEASFTKEEMQLGKHSEYEKRLIAYYLDVIAKEKEQKEKQQQQSQNQHQSNSNSPLTTSNSNTSKTNTSNFSVSNTTNYNGSSNDSETTSMRTWNGTNYGGHHTRNYSNGEADKFKTASTLNSSTSTSSIFTTTNNGNRSPPKSSNGYKKSNIAHQHQMENDFEQLYQDGKKSSALHSNKESQMDITSESSSMKADGSRWTNKDEMNGKLSTSAIKINKNSKENADSDSSSGNSSLSSTPNQVDQSVFASYCSSSSSSSGTSSLNLCDNSDSGNSSTGNSSKSSTPDNILQKQSNGTTNGENDVQTHKNANQTQPLDNDLSDSVGHDSSSSTLLQDDDDGLDFDPISLSSRALEDMLRSTSNTNGNSNGQSMLDNFNTSSFGGSGRMIDRNLPNGFHHHQQQQQQQHLPINNSPFDALLGGESSSFLANKSNSFGNNSNNNAFGPFGSLQQQQRQTLLNQQQTSPQNAASHLQQQQILEQLQQIQHQRQQLDLQHKLSQQSDKNLFGNMEMYLSNMVQQQHQQQQQQNSAQLFQLNQQNQPNSQTKLWQQNSLRQLLPNVNIKFQQPNVDDNFLSQSLANLGLNAFGSSNGGLNNQAQSLSPSALNAAAAASFFGSNANSGQGLRPSNHHSSNSQMMGNNSQFWQSNGGPKSPPHSNGNNVLSAQQHQFIQQQHQQQQLMRIQRPQQNANFNSFFMNQFLANNMNSNPNGMGQPINRPPPGF